MKENIFKQNTRIKQKSAEFEHFKTKPLTST